MLLAGEGLRWQGLLDIPSWDLTGKKVTVASAFRLLV